MTPLVLVHGFMGGSEQWRAQVEHMSTHHRVITPDLPGFGRNNHLPVIDSIAGFATWVLDYLEAQGIKKFHLLGHSMGGMIAQEMVEHAERGLVDRLILYGTGAVGVLPGRFETIEQSKRRAADDGADATARRISATWFLRRESDPAYAACANIAAQSAPAALPAGLDAMQAWSGEAALSSIEHPTLVLWGDSDRTYPWTQTEILWRNIPNSNLSVVPGAAHAVHLEKPALFNALIDEFLAATAP